MKYKEVRWRSWRLYEQHNNVGLLYNGLKNKMIKYLIKEPSENDKDIF